MWLDPTDRSNVVHDDESRFLSIDEGDYFVLQQVGGLMLIRTQ